MNDRLAQLQDMHASDPSDAFIPYGIALEHFKAGDHAAALTWLDKTLSLDPHYCYAYFQKAKVLSDRGDDDEARAVLETGMRAAVEVHDEHARGEMAELLASL